jgi:hypothetical protein
VSGYLGEESTHESGISFVETGWVVRRMHKTVSDCTAVLKEFQHSLWGGVAVVTHPESLVSLSNGSSLVSVLCLVMKSQP